MADHVLARDTLDWTAALEAARRVETYAPDSGWLYKLAYVALQANRPREAIAALLRIDTERGWMKRWFPYFSVLANSWHSVGEYGRELETIRQGQARFGRDRFWSQEIWALGFLGRVDEALDALERALELGEPGMIWGLNRIVLRLHRHRQHEVAATVNRRALDWYEGRPATEKEGLSVRFQHALLVLSAGNLSEARVLFEAVAEEAARAEARRTELDCFGYLATIALRQGDPARAKTLSRGMDEVPLPNGWERRRLSFVLRQLNWRARLGAEAGDREAAMRLLGEALGRGLAPRDHHYHGFESLWDYPPFQELLRPKG